MAINKDVDNYKFCKRGDKKNVKKLNQKADENHQFNDTSILWIKENQFASNHSALYDTTKQNVLPIITN